MEHLVDLFIPHEQALTLKTLGFDEKCLLEVQGGKDLFLGGYFADYVKGYQFEKTEEPMFIPDSEPITSNPNYRVGVPTWDQIFAWFETNHKLAVDVKAIYDDKSESYPFLGWGVDIYEIKSGGNIVYDTSDYRGKWFQTKKMDRKVHALEKLIDIVSNKVKEE